MDDPFDWDVERVVRELCSPNRTWRPSSSILKFPPLDQLEALIRNHEVDGEVLLTYDHAELCADLGIKILKHKSSLKNAVQDIRLLSKKYRLNQKRQAPESDEDPEDAEGTKTIKSSEHSQKLRLPEELASLRSSNSIISQREESSRDYPISHAAGQGPRITADTTVSPKSEAPPSGIQEPATKKRRVAPTTVSLNVDRDIARNIPTEADVISSQKRPTRSPGDPPIHDLSEHYLGYDAVTKFEILDGTSYAEMNLFQTGQVPPGRCLQLHRLMKRHLLRNRDYRRGLLTKLDVVPGADNPDHDEVLPLYGDSDEEYDSETWEEMEAEEKAKSTSDSRPKGLTAEEISAVLDETIERFASDWREYKLPKVARKANRLWNDARRFGLKREIERTQNDLRQYETRIAKYREEFQGPGQEWRNAGELKRTAAIFEQSVEDKEYSSWLLSTLTSSTEPPKAASLARNSTRRPRAPRPAMEDDEELLTSESEDGLDEFIVDDEIQSLAAAEYGIPMDIIEDVPQAQDDAIDGEHQDPIPVDGELPEPMDLTQAAEPTTMATSTPSKARTFDVVDLTTPQKQISVPSTQSSDGNGSNPNSVIIKSRNSTGYEDKQSNLIMTVNDLDSAERKVAIALTKLDQIYISLIFSLASRIPANTIWLDFVLRVLNNEGFPKAPYNTHDKKDALVTYTLIRLFEIYKNDAVYRLSRYKKLDDLGKQRIRDLRSKDNAHEFESFISFLRRLADRFDWRPARKHKKNQAPPAPVLEEKQKDRDNASTEPDDSDIVSDMNTDADEPSSSKKTKRKKFVRNQEAANLRENDQARAAEQAHRRKILRARLEQGGVDLGSQPAMIINESKRDDQGFIYVHEEISHRIKEHQVAGVRFMWNQIVDAETRQGCLLAHTMGLGKTMQIITLLVAIAQASHSPDPTISSQIPEELRESRTLVLCPSTLVNNWMDEMLAWSPEGHRLGEIYKLDVATHSDTRRHIIQKWGELGGILIVGYTLFKMCVKYQDLGKILLDNPSIVVADEAHMLKNPRTQLHGTTASFRTGSRIALTGSPLANNVEEYYAMINWVAHNYLGDPREFRIRYGIPIKEGLSVDSSSYQRRKALRMLHVLKSEAAPKVSRITISVLKNNTPTKKEFVLMVPLTELQRKAYEMYIDYRGQDKSSTGTFAATDTLGLICSHPFVFLAKLKELSENQKNSNNRNVQNGNESVNVTLPQKLINDEMALLCNAEKDLQSKAEQKQAVDEFSLSWKIPLLFAILEECKRLHDSVLLFSHQLGTLHYLEEALQKKNYSFVRLDGGTQMNQRQALVKDFNKGNTDIFLISTSAGSLGLNIVGANRVIIFDVKFNPQQEQQAVGRAYRIGQSKPVFVYRFVCGGTFEEKLLNQAIWKMQLASRVVDKKHPVPKAQPFNEGFGKPEEPEQKDLSEHRNKDSVLDNVLAQHGAGIRSITMMDTFEEESLEDAELTPEDRLEADKIIRENEARRLGRPPPQFPNLANGYSNGVQGLESGTPIDLTGMQGLPVSPLAGGFPSINGDQTAQPSQGLATLNLNTLATQFPNHLHGGVTSQNHAMSPIQGVTTHMRSSAGSVDSEVPNRGANWENWQAFRGELGRSLIKNTTGEEFERRSEIAQVVASKVWEQAEQQQPQLRGATKWAVMNAASSSRFVEAVCASIIDPDQLAQMPPADITAQRDSWDKLDDAEWEWVKNGTGPLPGGDQSNSDPQHLEHALRKMSSIPMEDDGMQGQEKSHRVDDKKAVEAVMERRKANQYSQTKPDLPNWAKNAVAKGAVLKQGQIAAPSSSASSQSAPSSRPSARDPFK
ncbi:hypothetical protein F5X99DRAFT_237696 [Biscogniauxia marginata]|nr:hypothetical protein F5X99DRAFT_237696 [Biscogniauxia marginata]